MKSSIKDRIISILAHFTFGFFSLIWLIFAYLTKKRSSPFLMFNLYQAIFVSLVFAVLSLVYEIAINFISVIPFVGKLANAFHLFFVATPIYFGTSISGMLVTLLILYFALACLIGKRPYIPLVSEIIKENFGV